MFVLHMFFIKNECKRFFNNSNLVLKICKYPYRWLALPFINLLASIE